MEATRPIERRTELGRRLDPRWCCLTRFSIHCDARDMYLRLARQDGSVIGLFEMDRAQGVGQWDLVMRLKPGSYRYRYYAKVGSLTAYVFPGEVEDRPRTMDGLDAVLSVPSVITVAANSRAVEWAGHHLCN